MKSVATPPWVRLPADPAQGVCNEMKCDRLGRLWVGVRAHDLESPVGALYRIDADGQVATVLEGVTIANGMGWSPDGNTFYLIDSSELAVDAFDFDVAGARSASAVAWYASRRERGHRMV